MSGLNDGLDVIKLNFEKSSEQLVRSYIDTQNIVGLKIIKSGWSEPQLYHCILEWGEYEDCNYHLYTKEEIKEKYNIDL
jgi:hypothetical protein